MCDESRLSLGLDDRTSEISLTSPHFGIRASHLPEVCDESRLSLGLYDRTRETSLTLPGGLGLFVCLG